MGLIGLREMIKFPAFITVFFLISVPGIFRKVELEIRNHIFIPSSEFSRIPEFFTGEEYVGTKIYARSDPKERSGFYFVVKVKGDSHLPEQSYWSLDWVSSSSPEVQSRKIPIKNKNIFGKELFIGLTGKDWPDQSIKLLAWRLRLMGDDKSLTERHSFLWSK